MAISVTFYQFDKKLNSTKQPIATTPKIALSVELKDVTNLYTPTLVISSDTFMSGGAIVNPMPYNYCYISDFSRYYFVRSWSWVLGRWECSLEVDVMATFKTEIGNTQAFVLRAVSQYNADIIDTKYPTVIRDLNGDQQYTTSTHPWCTNIKTASLSEGFYRVSISNNDVSAVGGVSHYAFSCTAMQELVNKLFSSPSWMGITDTSISNDLQKMLFDPMQYIVSVIWIPYGYSFTGAIYSIPIGWWSITLTNAVYRIDASNSLLTVPTINFPAPNHPQYNASSRRWVHQSPYTTAALFVPPFGYFAIDMSKVYECSALQISIDIDVITGMGTLFVTAYRTDTSTTPPTVIYTGTIYTANAQIGVPIAVTQMAVDWNALSSTSTWVMAAGISLAAGGLQESLKDLKNGLVDGAKELFADIKSKSNHTQTVGGITVDAIAGNDIVHGTYYGRGSSTPSTVVRSGSALDSSKQESSLLSSLKEIAGDIGSTALAASGTCTSSGSTGGFAALKKSFFVIYFYQMITGIDDTHNGIPLCATVKINLLSGFVLCGNTDEFTASCTQAERQAVRGIMEAGFYYE